MNRFKYYLQKLFGGLFDTPVIPEGKTVGYSMCRSDQSRVKYGVSTRVYPPFYLHEVELGDYSYIAKNSNINYCSIGKFCSIGPNFCCGLGIHPTGGISTSPMFYSTARQNGVTLCSENKIAESKKTFIGNDVFIGANVTILDGVRIGDGAIIGAGAVVTKDIPPYAIAVGVPAEVKRYRFDEKTIAELQEFRWWDKGIDEYKRVERFFWDSEQFLHE
jgi:acetyltransferase-like isoleucine patch superfamily enzyme